MYSKLSSLIWRSACKAGMLLLLCAAPLASAGEAESAQLQELLARYNESVQAPAWVAAVVQGGEIIAEAGVGVGDKQAGKPIDVATAKFHWGSITKSVTATMLAAVVEAGELRWDSTLGEVLAELPMREEYRSITLASLLNHRADLPPYTRLGPPEAARFAAYSGTATDKRGQFVREVLQEAVPAREGPALVYSNSGPVVAAYMAEVATGESWDSLVQTHVFDRLGLLTASVGLPAETDPSQTRGHAGPDAATVRALPPGPAPGGAMLAPSGNINSTVHDLALYARAHLQALAGQAGQLSLQAMQSLHTPPDDGRTLGPLGEDYAMGWGLRRDGAQLVHWHNGSNGMFFAQVDLYPQDDLAIVVMSNAGFPGRSAPELVRQIRSLYLK